MAALANTTGQINITLNCQQVQSTGVVASTAGGGSLTYPGLITLADQILNGTGAAKTCDQMYASQLTLSAAITAIHLNTPSTGAKDPAGNVLAMARVRLLAVQVVDTTSGHDVKVEQSATNPIAWMPTTANPAIARANGGMVLIYDPNSNGAGVGNTITASTADGFQLDPGANTVVVNVVVLGDSVA